MSKSNTPPKSPYMLNIALIGNPNCGKTTLFNQLTGGHRRIGNWPGVTVEQQHGEFFDKDNKLNVHVVDLPGCYSLIATPDIALDEKVTCEYVLNARNTTFVNVVDAAHLSRDLYLTLQLLELGVPVIVALNCMDLAKQAGLKIHARVLSESLGCPVVPIVAKNGENLVNLRHAMALANDKRISNTYLIDYPRILQPTINFWRANLTVGQALHALEGDVLLTQKLAAAQIDCNQVRNQLALQLNANLDLIIAQHRRSLVQQIIKIAVTKQIEHKTSFSEKVDAIVLHNKLGPVIFLGIMYLMFTVAINLGGLLQLAFDQISENLFVNNLHSWLLAHSAPGWVVDILAFGLGKGINITITFVPVLTAMFLCLGILESSGYMTRAAFIVDRLMRVFGLPGKAFVPLIVGFGCNVPAVMGARTLSNRRERILTIMMTPFMSCSARLAIYAIFVTAFFPVGGQNIIFSLYLIGILVAVLTGLALRSTVIPSERSLSLMEMPDYRWPTVSVLFRQVGYRLKSFVIKAGGLIILLCVLVNGLGSARLETIGKNITPIFAPIGISSENWPATVGLITGLVAKEAVIGTLNSVYTNTAGLPDDTHLDNSLSASAEHEMVQRFGGTTAAYAYLLFTLLYFPCVSVVAVIAKELSKRWALFSVLWSTGLAYLIAALYYQTATWTTWYSSATVWIAGLLITLGSVFIATRIIINKNLKPHTAQKFIPTPINIVN